VRRYSSELNGHIHSSIKEEEVFIDWVFFDILWVGLRILVMNKTRL